MKPGDSLTIAGGQNEAMQFGPLSQHVAQHFEQPVAALAGQGGKADDPVILSAGLFSGQIRYFKRLKQVPFVPDLNHRHKHVPARTSLNQAQILKNLEQTEFDSEGRPKLARTGIVGAPKERQLSLFAPVSDAVAEDIRKTDVNALTPIEALNLLVELKKKLDG